jgi:hypothetical protein
VLLHRNKFIFNNKTEPLIIQIYSVIKLYYVSGILSAHHQEFSTVHSAPVSFMQVFLMTASKQSQDGTAVPSCSTVENS